MTRALVLKGRTYKIRLSCVDSIPTNLYVTVNRDSNEHIVEVFSTMGKAGSCYSCIVNSLCRVISKALQEGLEIKEIVESMQNMSCDKPSFGHGLEGYDKPILSCADAIAKVLKKELE